jgi:hypothetical protein
VIDGYLDKIQQLALSSHKDAQKLVTAGTIPTLILLLKTRAVDGIGLETVLLTLGILAYVLRCFHVPVSSSHCCVVTTLSPPTLYIAQVLLKP